MNIYKLRSIVNLSFRTSCFLFQPFGNSPNSIPVTIVNDNSKYGGAGVQRQKAGPPPRSKGMGQIDVIGTTNPNKTSTIQVFLCY